MNLKTDNEDYSAGDVIKKCVHHTVLRLKGDTFNTPPFSKVTKGVSQSAVMTSIQRTI